MESSATKSATALLASFTEILHACGREGYVTPPNDSPRKRNANFAPRAAPAFRRRRSDTPVAPTTGSAHSLQPSEAGSPRRSHPRLRPCLRRDALFLPPKRLVLGAGAPCAQMRPRRPPGPCVSGPTRLSSCWAGAGLGCGIGCPSALSGPAGPLGALLWPRCCAPSVRERGASAAAPPASRGLEMWWQEVGATTTPHRISIWRQIQTRFLTIA